MSIRTLVRRLDRLGRNGCEPVPEVLELLVTAAATGEVFSHVLCTYLNPRPDGKRRSLIARTEVLASPPAPEA